MEYEVGAILEGKVTSITKFGAFVALEGGKSGLVHISEIANTYVNDVHDFLQEGQVVKVKLLAIKEGKLDLSIKKARPAFFPAPPCRCASRRPAACCGPPPALRTGAGRQYLPFRRHGLRGQAEAVSLLLRAENGRSEPEHFRQAGRPPQTVSRSGVNPFYRGTGYP